MRYRLTPEQMTIFVSAETDLEKNVESITRCVEGNTEVVYISIRQGEIVTARKVRFSVKQVDRKVPKNYKLLGPIVDEGSAVDLVLYEVCK